MAFPPNGVNTNIRVPELRHTRRRSRIRHSTRLLKFIAFENLRLGAAIGTLTAAGQPANADVVTVGGVTYTFQTSLVNAANNVLIGGTVAASLTNLKNAINRDGTNGSPGVDFGAATVTNPLVSAISTATTVVVTAKASGTAGNSIGSTKTSVNLSWGGAVLAGGVAANVATALKKNAATTVDNVALYSTLK